MREEKDPQHKDQRNTILEGSLLIASSSINKRPGLVSPDFKNFILYECLFHDEKLTKNTEIKCKNKFSIPSAL